MKFIISLIFLCLPLLTQAELNRSVLTLPGKDGSLADNRVAYVEYEAPSNENSLPILLLGPGVNRGVLSFDSLLDVVRARGYGFISLHFSTLPHSVAALGADKTPFFDEEDFEMEDYAKEFEAVAQWARNEFGRDVVPVTLSYSGAPSSLLKSFKTIVDLAPMISLKDARPTLYYFYSNLRAANIFNPFGAAVIRASMDQTYYPVWRPKTEEMIKGFGFNEALEDNILEGYMTSSRALEGFEWEVEETPSETTRYLVLAERESSSLLKGQVNILKEFYEEGKSAGCFFVRGAEHAISFSHPTTTALIIDAIVRNSLAPQPGCFDVRGLSDWVFVPVEDFDSLFDL